MNTYKFPNKTKRTRRLAVRPSTKCNSNPTPAADGGGDFQITENNIIASKMSAIMNLAYRLNHIPTAQDCTGNKPTVFIYFFGHVGRIEVTVCPDGYAEECIDTRNKDAKMTTYKTYYYQQEGIKTLDACICFLERLLEENRENE